MWVQKKLVGNIKVFIIFTKKMKRIGVVITTISNGNFLKKFIESTTHANAQIKFYIMGDLNTLPECKKNVQTTNEESFSCQYFDVDEQIRFLDKLNFSPSFIPTKSDNRRNIGYLKAVEDGCDVILSMDDDNFPIDKDFFNYHATVGDPIDKAILISETRNGWFNPMVLLDTQTKNGEHLTVYPRGFPYAKRWNDVSTIGDTWIKGRIGVNVGLWTGDPDIDAITRLTTQCSSTIKPIPENVALRNGHVMPINSQNTSLVREAVTCYYFLKMGYTVNGIKMDRFGDIFSGYFLHLCNRSVGNLVTIGNPIVFQERNEHNLLKDLKVELPGILIIEELIPFLESVLPSSTSYHSAYSHLIENLTEFTHRPSKSSFWTQDSMDFITDVTGIMKAWTKACKTLGI